VTAPSELAQRSRYFEKQYTLLTCRLSPQLDHLVETGISVHYIARRIPLQGVFGKTRAKDDGSEVVALYGGSCVLRARAALKEGANTTLVVLALEAIPNSLTP
jgi:hypothetical protein